MRVPSPAYCFRSHRPVSASQTKCDLGPAAGDGCLAASCTPGWLAASLQPLQAVDSQVGIEQVREPDTLSPPTIGCRVPLVEAIENNLGAAIGRELSYALLAPSPV